MSQLKPGGVLNSVLNRRAGARAAACRHPVIERRRESGSTLTEEAGRIAAMARFRHNDRRSARLPPLRSVQAFEAASRHLSFKAAAEELSVTPTAISHQIKTLEAHLGVRLFHRLPRTLKLTSAGEAYAPHVRQAFEKLAEASLALRSDDVEGQIAISTTMSLAGQWLGPRLPRFQKLYSDLAVRVSSSDAVADFARDGIDVAIRYGFGDYPGMHVVWVLDDYVAPVCAPGFAPRPRSAREAARRCADQLRVEWILRAGSRAG